MLKCCSTTFMVVTAVRDATRMRTHKIKYCEPFSRDQVVCQIRQIGGTCVANGRNMFQTSSQLQSLPWVWISEAQWFGGDWDRVYQYITAKNTTAPAFPHNANINLFLFELYVHIVHLDITFEQWTVIFNSKR